MIRFTLTVSGALVLIASTGFNSVCMAVEKMGAPRSFAVQLLFLYRYIFVLADEASRMVRARALRTFGRGGTGMRVFTSMIGQLLLRTLDRAQRIHLAMRCRGFDGTSAGPA
jgi:cobalt/nickel transport system permease protein